MTSGMQNELLVRSRKKLFEAKKWGYCSFLRVLVLEWVDWFNLQQTVYKGPFVTTSALESLSWHLATTVPEPASSRKGVKWSFSPYSGLAPKV